MVELSESLKEEDRISQLPDPLICLILSHLPTKESVRTSVLSTIWKSLWLWVPRLKLDSENFSDLTALVSFGNRFFDSNRVSSIDSLKLKISKEKNMSGGEDVSYLTSWIANAVKRKVQHLLVWCPLESNVEIPLSLYVFKTLVSLKLVGITLNDDAEFLVSFPCLKTLHLNYFRFSNEATLERLVSCCPVLEDLETVGCVNTSQVCMVHSQSLKTLFFSRVFVSLDDTVPLGVIIDAPQLSYLTIIDLFSKSFIVNNLKSSAELDIALTFGLFCINETSVSSVTSHIRNFLAGISKVGDLTIYTSTFKIMYIYSKSEPLPQFGYMTRLCVTLDEPNVKWLPTFLERCPNLKSLALRLDDYFDLKKLHSGDMNQVVPKCLLSSLEFVVFKFQVWSLVAEMKLVKYFLENSAILKKLTLHLDSHLKEDKILKQLSQIPRASTRCEVVIVKP